MQTLPLFNYLQHTIVSNLKGLSQKGEFFFNTALYGILLLDKLFLKKFGGRNYGAESSKT